MRKVNGSTLVEVVLAVALLCIACGILFAGFAAAGNYIVRGQDYENQDLSLAANLEKYLADPSTLDTADYSVSTDIDTVNGVSGQYCTITHNESGLNYTVFIPE